MSFHGSAGRPAFPQSTAGIVPSPTRLSTETFEKYGGSQFDCCQGVPNLPAGDPHARCDWVDFARGCFYPCAMAQLNAYGNYQPGEDHGASFVSLLFADMAYGLCTWVPHMAIRFKVAARLNGGVRPMQYFDCQECCCMMCCSSCLACQELKAMRYDTTTAVHDARVNTFQNQHAGTSQFTGQLIEVKGGGVFDCCSGVPGLDMTDAHEHFDFIDFAKGLICPCDLMGEANAFADYQPTQDSHGSCAICGYSMMCMHCCVFADVRRKVEARLNGGKEAPDHSPMNDMCLSFFCAPCVACQTMRAVRAETTRNRLLALATAQPPIATNYLPQPPVAQAAAEVAASVGTTVGSYIGGRVAGSTGAAIGGAIGGAFGSKAAGRVAPAQGGSYA